MMLRGYKSLIAFLGATILFPELILALNFTFTVRGRDLPLMENPLDGNPDAYMSVFYAYGSQSFKHFGDSLVIDDTQNPDWEDKWVFQFTPGVSERLRFEIWDESRDGDVLIGSMDEIYFAELYNNENGIIEKNLIGGTSGRVILNITRDAGYGY